MAKARRVPGLSADQPYAAAAVRIVEVRVGELMEHSRGVLDVSETGRVHDMRVATRRLRAALEIFERCFPRQELRAALRDVKAIADALGERRDCDVAIGALEDVSESMTAPDRPGIETLIARLRAEQDAANEALGTVVTPDRLAALGDRVHELLAGAETPEADQGPSGEAVWLPRQTGGAVNGAGLRAVGEA